MNAASFQAIFLALILSAPLVILLRTRLLARPAALRGPVEFVASSSPRGAIFAGLAGCLLFTLAVLVFPNGEPSVAASGRDQQIVRVLLFVALAAVALTPFYPPALPIVYVCLAYVFPREHAVTERLMATGAFSWLVAGGALGVYAWGLRTGRAIVWPYDRFRWSAAWFGAAVALAILAALVFGRPVGDELVSRSIRYGQALGLFFVVSSMEWRLRDLRVMALLFCAVLIARQQWLSSGWFLEQNLAMLATIAAPFALALAFSRPFGVLQLALAPAAIAVAALVVLIQNRGALLGLGAALLIMAFVSKNRWRWLLGGILAVMPFAIWAGNAGLFDRFWQIYSDGRFLGSAADRLDIWSMSLPIIRDYWLFGVGPGNFALISNRYAHNSVFEVLTEVGVAGAVLYVLMFVNAIRRLAVQIRAPRGDWRRGAAHGLLGAMVAHLVAGVFLSNAPLAWSYVLLGVCAAIALTGHEEVSSS